MVPGLRRTDLSQGGALRTAMQSVRRKYRSPGFQKFSQRAAQRIGDLLECRDGRVRLTRLDQGNCRLRQPGPLRQIGLSQAAALTRPAEFGAKNGNRRSSRRGLVQKRPFLGYRCRAETAGP
jgi:hypothetical protein